LGARAWRRWSVAARVATESRASGPSGAAARRCVEQGYGVDATPLYAAARYVVRVGDVELELDDDFRDETLRRLVGVLRSC
jgi:DNA-binding transcriptional LysR family regulator